MHVLIAVEGRRRRARNTSLALIATALAGLAAPAIASDVVPPTIYTLTPTGVNVSDGGFTFSNIDLSIGSLSLERSWIGGPVHDSKMTNNFDIYVQVRDYATKGPGSVTHHRAIVHLGPVASGSYEVSTNVTPNSILPNSGDGYAGILEKPGDAFVYTDQSGTVYTFDGSGPSFQRVTNIGYPDGRSLTLTYDASNRLKLVKSSDGYALLFQYVGTTSSAVCSFNTARSVVTAASTCSGAAAQVGYAYASGLLTGYTDTLGRTTKYDYVSGQVSCITPPGYVGCKLANTYVTNGLAFYRVSQQTLADGSIWSFTGGSPNTRNPDYQPEEGDTNASVTDPDKNVSYFKFTKSSPYSAKDANGRITQYRYDGGSFSDSVDPTLPFGSMLVQVTLPEGNEYLASYDPGHFNLPYTRTWKAKAQQPSLADRTERFSYPSCDAPNTRQMCVHPASITDPKGNVTDYSYNIHGQPVAELQPAPANGAARPLKLFSYADKYAYTLNAFGTLTAEAMPISTLTSETQCQAAAGSSTPTCDPAAQQTVTTYEYGPDGTPDSLLLRGKVVTADGQSRRICMGYDAQGNKTSETNARAGLTSCP